MRIQLRKKTRTVWAIPITTGFRCAKCGEYLPYGAKTMWRSFLPFLHVHAVVDWTDRVAHMPESGPGSPASLKLVRVTLKGYFVDNGYGLAWANSDWTWWKKKETQLYGKLRDQTRGVKV